MSVQKNIREIPEGRNEIRFGSTEGRGKMRGTFRRHSSSALWEVWKRRGRETGTTTTQPSSQRIKLAKELFHAHFEMGGRKNCETVAKKCGRLGRILNEVKFQYERSSLLLTWVLPGHQKIRPSTVVRQLRGSEMALNTWASPPRLVSVGAGAGAKF